MSHDTGDFTQIFFIVFVFIVTVILYIVVTKVRNWFCPADTSEPRESQEEVRSISIIETTELPSYEELQAKPEEKSPPDYWTLFPYKMYYDKPVWMETLV